MVEMIPCFFCKGPWHPATGHVYGESTLSCFTCTRDFYRWVESHTNKRPGKKKMKVPTKESFYEAATNSFAPRSPLKDPQECPTTRK